MIIQHNMMSISAGKDLKVVTNTKNKSMERLSSGYRINRAADDAAGLSISEEMRGQVRGLNRSVLNTADGMSLANVTDGAMQELHNVFHRIRELCVQSANDTNASLDRDVIAIEIEQLVREVDNIGNNTEFNTIKVLQGEPDKEFGVQAGANTGEIVQIQLPHIDSEAFEMDRINVLDSVNSSQSIEYMDEMMDKLDNERAKMGAFYNRLEYAYANNENAAENQQSAESKIRDTDMADEMVTFSAQSILEQSGISMLTQANSTTQGVVGLLQ